VRDEEIVKELRTLGALAPQGDGQAIMVITTENDPARAALNSVRVSVSVSAIGYVVAEADVAEHALALARELIRNVIEQDGNGIRFGSIR
jgi:hypothetical protein